MENLVTIAEAEGPKADFIKSVLETHGITVFVDNPHTSSILGRQMVIPAKIQVPEDQINKAQEVLKTIEESQASESVDFDDDLEYYRRSSLTRLTRIVNIISIVGLLFFIVGTGLFFTNLPKNVRWSDVGSNRELRQQQEINEKRANLSMVGGMLSGLGIAMVALRIAIYVWTRRGT